MGKYRSIDGSNNNNNKGKVNTQLIRLFEPAFEDGISTPRGGEISEFNSVSRTFVDMSALPNPRTISNTVIDNVNSTTNFLNASDWLWQWGQVIDHDFALNENNAHQPQQGEFSPIVVEAANDPIQPFLTFVRVPAATGTGETTPRQINNQITAFIDGSLVYGADQARANFLRDAIAGKGLLKTTVAENGEALLPLNPINNPYPNADGGVLGKVQFLAGDVRVNEQVGLTAAHTLLVRDHNQIALDLDERLNAGDTALTRRLNAFSNQQLRLSPGKTEQQIRSDFLYESARKVIGAKIQVITYEEFVPQLIGNTLSKYKGFKSSVDPQISVEFANAAFRLGHTLLSNQLQRVDSNGTTATSLTDAFFTPEDVQAKGVDSLLTGLIFQAAQEIDHQLVDGVREFLFPAGTGGLDLGAVNIARGRETGVGGYTEILAATGGPTIASFSELRQSGLFSNSVVTLFEAVYETVEQIDLWLGGIAELPDANHGGLLGPTLSYFVADQFSRSRDGDKFFYLNDLEHLKILDPNIKSTTLSDLIRNNVADPYLVPDDAFTVPFSNAVTGNARNNNLRGTSANDLIEGKAGRDTVNGQNGDDILFGGTDNDRLNGGKGSDRLLGGTGKDSLYGQDGNDYLAGGENDDILNGGRGSDTLNGGRGDDVLKGGENRDTFLFGSDLIDGIADTDTITQFEASDIFDFSQYLSAGGTLDFQRINRQQLSISLGGEDTTNVIGSGNAINAAANQLGRLIG